ncbi:hypothetical protein H2248_007331 [Termitomyces sp. 'cryptogamus']|nr:hypothetical protein H2248_007331 [Termitomyces sp. 'cryptogamus']
MGGRAFLATLGPGLFPRIPLPVYNALKNRLLPRLQALYRRAIVPREAPEKLTFGDLDILVTGPRPSNLTSGQTDVPHTILRDVLGAQCYVRHDSRNRTVNFAVPIQPGEWEALNLGKEEEEIRQAAGGQDVFYQVDVNTCVDEAEHERTAFFHGYGDLGMIMCVVARNADPALVLGEKGLRLSLPPQPRFELSQSLDDITKFMGWSMETWKAGFRTNREAFEWVGSSRFFNPQGFRTHGEGIPKVSKQRIQFMYTEFVQWVAEKAANTPLETQHNNPAMTVEERQLAFREHALVYFNKKQDYEAMVHKQSERARLKKVFNSSTVRQWTCLGQDWKALKLVMDTVRKELDGDAGILKLYDELGTSGVKRFVLEVQKQLSLASTTMNK